MSCQDLPADTTSFQKNLKTMVSVKDWDVSDKASSFGERGYFPTSTTVLKGRIE